MDDKIRVGIVGYGNLGKGVEKALAKNSDFKLEAIFTRREINDIKSLNNVVNISEIYKYEGIIDVMVLCGGSATDLPEQSPEIARAFNIVDSFDTHANINDHFNKVDEAARKSGKVGIISVGWDPGLFSLSRLLGSAILPEGKDYTFWGKGVSQGHSDAIRRVKGVKNAIQYTVPIEAALDEVRQGLRPELSSKDKHERICYVVPEPNANLDEIANTIKSMPNYFAEYNTTVNFISEDELKKSHSQMPHGGKVIHTGNTSEASKQRIEFSLELDSNPEFTGSVLVAYARAACRLSREGISGAKTVFDIPLSYLSINSGEELRKKYL